MEAIANSKSIPKGSAASGRFFLIAAILGGLALGLPIYYIQNPKASNMPIYTFITEFQGGTYINQQQADDLRAACFLWKEEIAGGGYVLHLNNKAFSKAFDADIDELPPIPLDELRNVWLFHLMLGDDLLDLHIVQTDTSPAYAETLELAQV